MSRVDWGHWGRMYRYQSWEVSHAVSGPLKEPTGAFPVREVVSILGPNGRSLIPLRNPQMGPERGGEMTEKALPLHLPVASLLPFSSHHRMPWSLGKNAQKG